MHSHSSYLFGIGQSLLVDFGLYAPNRLVFFDMSCLFDSVNVGGLWLLRSLSSCLFDFGQSLLVDFDLCAPTRLIFLTLVSHCCRTLTCALPLILSF